MPSPGRGRWPIQGCWGGQEVCFTGHLKQNVLHTNTHKSGFTWCYFPSVPSWACEGPGAPWWAIPVRRWQKLLKQLSPHFSHEISELEDRVASYLLASPEIGQSEMRSSEALRHFRGHYLLAIRLITMMDITLASADHGFQLPARALPPIILHGCFLWQELVLSLFFQ